jgi:glutamate racemase
LHGVKNNDVVNHFSMQPIGVFDSGYGGLTVLRAFTALLPQYDYLYLGDNARTPYGNRSFETVYRYTLECVQWLLKQDCPLIILACNTASAKALRTIQQNDLYSLNPDARVLGVIRPTTEIIGQQSRTGHVGILATNGTVQSGSYLIEIEKFYPELCGNAGSLPHVGAAGGERRAYRQRRRLFCAKAYQCAILARNPEIDTLLLACTHYPLLQEKIKRFCRRAYYAAFAGRDRSPLAAGLPAPPSGNGNTYYKKRPTPFLYNRFRRRFQQQSHPIFWRGGAGSACFDLM